MSVTTGMVGRGFYNRNSATQLAAIDHVMPWLEAAAANLPLDDTLPAIVLADFGSSEGRNSITVMERLVGACRARSERPIATVHSDLPTNDFTQLLIGLRPDGRSIFGDANVYSAAVGGSMFDQLLPPRSSHIATTFNAIGFLSKRPVERLAGYILPNGPSKRGGVGHVSAQDRRLFADQARADIATFLKARAAELVPGGKLLLQVFGSGEERRTCDGIYDVLNDAMLETMATGQFSREAYDSYYQPVYFRTLDELTGPITDKDSPAAGLFDLEQAETYEVPVPFVDEMRRSSDMRRYAQDYTDFYRAFTEPVVRAHFANHPALDALIGEIYGRAERMVRDDPERYEFHYIALAALMTRRDDRPAG